MENKNTKSEAIWIRSNSIVNADQQSPSSRWNFKRSMSVNSDSSSTSSSSFGSSFSAFMMGSNKNEDQSANVGRRPRTYTTSSIGSDDDRSPFSSSPPSASPFFRRSNSISAGCYNSDVFNNVVKRSMNVFNAAKVNTSLAVPIQKSVPKVRQPADPDMRAFRKNSDRNNNMTDTVVSILCENAIR